MTRHVLCIVMGLAAGAQSAAGQQLTCSTIRSGDTASGLAARMTGDSDSHHRPWFQIVNPATGTFVPKSAYDDISAGWHACLVQQPLSQGLRRSDHLLLLLCGILGVAAALLWTSVDAYLDDRQATVTAMQRFAEYFVREFERPLAHPPVEGRPIRSHVKLRPDHHRLDILLAPGNGKRYPNLADHRANVAYDVDRVLHQINDPAFVCAPLYTQRGWVVVPFNFRGSPKQAGGL